MGWAAGCGDVWMVIQIDMHLGTLREKNLEGGCDPLDWGMGYHLLETGECARRIPRGWEDLRSW